MCVWRAFKLDYHKYANFCLSTNFERFEEKPNIRDPFAQTNPRNCSVNTQIIDRKSYRNRSNEKGKLLEIITAAESCILFTARELPSSNIELFYPVSWGQMKWWLFGLACCSGSNYIDDCSYLSDRKTETAAAAARVDRALITPRVRRSAEFVGKSSPVVVNGTMGMNTPAGWAGKLLLVSPWNPIKLYPIAARSTILQVST